MEEAIDGISLNLGCGKKKWDGWVNVDYANADVNCDLKALPFPDNYADRIATIHVLEHFWPWEVDGIMEEWKRVLKPGGQIILELPDMERVFQHIFWRMRKGESPSPSFSWHPIWGNPSHESVAMMHKWGYFATDLQMLLERFFVDVKQDYPKYHFPIRDMRFTGVKHGNA